MLSPSGKRAPARCRRGWLPRCWARSDRTAGRTLVVPVPWNCCPVRTQNARREAICPMTESWLHPPARQLSSLDSLRTATRSRPHCTRAGENERGGCPEPAESARGCSFTRSESTPDVFLGRQHVRPRPEPQPWTQPSHHSHVVRRLRRRITYAALYSVAHPYWRKLRRSRGTCGAFASELHLSPALSPRSAARLATVPVNDPSAILHHPVLSIPSPISLARS